MIALRVQRIAALAGVGDTRSLTALAPASSVTVNRHTGEMPCTRLSIRAHRGLGVIRVGARVGVHSVRAGVDCLICFDGVRIAADTLVPVMAWHTQSRAKALPLSPAFLLSSLFSARRVVNGGVLSLDPPGQTQDKKKKGASQPGRSPEGASKVNIPDLPEQFLILALMFFVMTLFLGPPDEDERTDVAHRSGGDE